MTNNNEEKQIVWVFGASAAGKATFITYVSDYRPSDLLSIMGWKNKTISAEQYSLSLVGQTSYHDSNTRKRFRIIPSAINELVSNDVVLIKGQQVDLENRRPQVLRSRVNGCRHSVIYLDAGLDETEHRMRLKPWWDDKFTSADIETWRHSQIEVLRGLQGFDFQMLDSSEPNSYKHIAES